MGAERRTSQGFLRMRVGAGRRSTGIARGGPHRHADREVTLADEPAGLRRVGHRRPVGASRRERAANGDVIP